MDIPRYVVTVVALLACAAGYGADLFAAIALRPALSHVDDDTLTVTMGRIHQYADRRLPAPFLVGIVGAAFGTVAAIITGQAFAAAANGVAVVTMVAWIVIYFSVAAPVNKALTTAAVAGRSLAEARALQRKWEGAIVPRVLLQTLTLAALGFSLAFS